MSIPPINIFSEMISAVPDHKVEELVAIREEGVRLCALPWKSSPAPPSLSGMRSAEIHARFVIGREPIPDLAAAEYIRTELQYLAVRWTRAVAEAGQALSKGTKALELEKRAENRRRLVIDYIAKGDYSAPAELARKVNDMLVLRPDLAEKYGFARPVAHKRGKTRPKSLLELDNMVKNLKRVFAIAATQADIDEVTYDFSFAHFD
jgi:hypothetical protein